jgi:CRISPR-associated protein (TIGR03986 family)
MNEDRNHFLNPYNFVRYLNERRPEGHVLGDCPPAPHDRYIGLTGRVVCELKAVTPLFISDSHAVQGEVGEHRTFRFFKIEDEDGQLAPALPATSLRGMVRSVFEAVTNSCFAVFNGQQRLEFRERPEFGNRVKGYGGIVNALPEPAKNGQPAKDGEIVLCQIAEVGAYYEEEEEWKNVLGHKPNGRPWHCGEHIFARVEQLTRRYIVRELSTSQAQLQPLSDGEDYVEGWLKITGKGEGTSKRKECLFLHPKHGCPGVVRFSFEAMVEYNSVLAGQLDRDALPVSPESRQLTLGDLVWVEPERDGQRARRVVRVQVPRTPYKHPVEELLPNHLHHCDKYDRLCPACRVFGWVHEKAGELGKKERVAYAGRVRFSHGKLIGGAKKVDDPVEGITLAILSTPKPTMTQFYLFDQNERPGGNIDYDTRGARLRGRKVYRHHGETPSMHQGGRYEYERAGGAKDDQNRTVCGVLDKGTTFEFTVDFENLALEELGALIWSLELERGMHHRLGYGKPLGFGSVIVKIKSLEVLDPQQRFASLTSDGWKTVAEWGDWVDQFKTQMVAEYNHWSSFDALPNIRDLRALTCEPDVKYIHYPRLDPEPQLEGENFRWFVKNKKLDRPHALDLADSDKGLPLEPGRNR